MATKRNLAPRPVVTSPPLMVSDLTSFNLIGLTGRQLREFLAKHPEVRRTVIGQRVVIRADVLLEALDRFSRGGSAPAISDTDRQDEEGFSVEVVLATVGRRSGG